MTELSSPVRVAYARCASYEDRLRLREAIARVLAVQIEDFGGSICGKKIMLKPNLLAWRRNPDIACVHPFFLVESARCFLEAARRVGGLENPGVQNRPPHPFDGTSRTCRARRGGFQF